MGFGEVLKNSVGVANKLMASGIQSALDSNPMYNADDVRTIIKDKQAIGPLELAKLHEAKRKVRDLLISDYLQTKRKYQRPMPAFAGQDELDGHSDDAREVFFREEVTDIVTPCIAPLPTAFSPLQLFLPSIHPKKTLRVYQMFRPWTGMRYHR